MGCYRCGSEEGSESQLCPTCAEIRRVERTGLAQGRVPKRLSARSQSRSGRAIERSAIERIAFDQKTVLILCGALITLFLGFRLVMYHLSAPNLPPDRLNALYEKCVESMREQLKTQTADVAGRAGAQEDFKEVVSQILNRGISKAGGAEGICAYLTEECKVNPYGKECRSGVKSFLGDE